MLTALVVLDSIEIGFLFGRIWQIRRDELERDFGLPTIARIPQRTDAGR